MRWVAGLIAAPILVMAGVAFAATPVTYRGTTSQKDRAGRAYHVEVTLTGHRVTDVLVPYNRTCNNAKASGESLFSSAEGSIPIRHGSFHGKLLEPMTFETMTITNGKIKHNTVTGSFTVLATNSVITCHSGHVKFKATRSP